MEPPFSGGGRIQAPERPQHRPAGLRLIAGVQQADQRGHAQGPGHQHDLVVGIRLLLPEFVEQRRGRLELLFGEPDIANEAMQMPDQGDHDLAQPRVPGALHHPKHRARQICFIANDHVPGNGRCLYRAL